jgi:hypothetical protein
MKTIALISAETILGRNPDMRRQKLPSRRASRFGRAFVLVTATAGQAAALSFDETPTIDKVAAEATLAFRGRVEEVRYAAARVSEMQTIPYANIWMTVGEAFGGVDGNKVTLRQMGGRLPDHPTRFLVIPGLAELEPTERAYILANDGKQPFFATLYGDYSLFRIAEDETGRQLVMNAHWQPLQTDGQRIWPTAGLYCEPATPDRGKCVTKRREAADTNEDEDVAAREGRPMTVSALDRLIRQWRADRPNKPGQTVSADESRFAKALAEFGRAISAPSNPDELIDSGERP